MKRILRAVLIGSACGVVSLVAIRWNRPEAAFILPPEPARSTVAVLVSRPTSTEPVLTGGSPETPPVPMATTSSRLLFVGDIMLDRGVAKRMKESGDPAYPFRKLPDGWFDSFDYAVANLEGPVTDKHRSPEKSIDFLFDPSVLQILKFEGIDAVSQANNHALDQGNPGYEDSTRRLRAAGLLVFGHQVRDDDIAMATTTVNELRFAFLGFNTTDNPLDFDVASSTIAHAKSQTDRVIVFMHWGIEYKDHPTEEVRRTAHWFIDHGVDVVIGGHPHWYQGMESYKGHPIVYSLGNFVFDQYFSKEVQQGTAIELDFSSNQISVHPIPIQLVASQPHVAEGAEREQRLKELAAISDAALKTQIEQGNVTF